MKPIDFSLQTFAELKANLHEDRAEVHRAWLAHGPGTTREVSAKSQIDILTFRPRTTDLFQLGLVELSGKDGHQGIYRARTLEQWENFVATRRLPATGQLALAIKTAVILLTACLSLSAGAMDQWAALSQIESGDNDFARGHFGEISRYQIRHPEWRHATALPFHAATNAVLALAVAKVIQGGRTDAFALAHHRSPSPVEFYLLWNQPARVDRPTSGGVEKARRFENLINKK